jgi:hypothetical protein
MSGKPRHPVGEIVVRWRTREDGSVYFEGYTRYPPRSEDGEDWSRGNDLSDGTILKDGTLIGFGRNNPQTVAADVVAVLTGERL